MSTKELGQMGDHRCFSGLNPRHLVKALRYSLADTAHLHTCSLHNSTHTPTGLNPATLNPTDPFIRHHSVFLFIFNLMPLCSCGVIVGLLTRPQNENQERSSSTIKGKGHGDVAPEWTKAFFNVLPSLIVSRSRRFKKISLL